MPDDTPSQLRESAATVAVIAAVLGAGVIYTERTIPSLAPASPRLMLAWGQPDPDPRIVTEVWHTTNLVDWYLLTNVCGTNVVLPRDKPAEFFKIRNRLDEVVCLTNSTWSDWSRRTN